MDAAALTDPVRIRSAVFEAGIVLVRGWFGDEYRFVEVGRSIGELERASPKDMMHGGELFRVTSAPGDAQGIGRYWHADGFAHSSDPACITIYHVAKGATPSAGTSFLDGFMAWRDLPRPLCARVGELWWVHPSGHRHRFVRMHELHRTPALSVNLGKIARIEGLEEQSTRQLVEELTDALDRMAHYTHGWENGHLLMVDNRRMLHRAPPATPVKREVWRTSVLRFRA